MEYRAAALGVNDCHEVFTVRGVARARNGIRRQGWGLSDTLLTMLNDFVKYCVERE